MHLPATLPDFVERDADLARRNTLALAAHAALLARITMPAQLSALIDTGSLRGMRRFVLGGGSNLVLSGDYEGLVLHMAIPGRALASEDADAWYVRAGRVKTGTTLSAGRWRKAGRGWRISR